jgi:site-specific DNA recombinase
VPAGPARGAESNFYYVCRGKQLKDCDLPYLQVGRVERKVEDHYATVQLSEDFSTLLQAKMDSTRNGAKATNQRLHGQLTQQLAKLELQEDRYLDLVGDPDWPKEKLSAKMRAIREE